jgi:hypothetical protein
MAQSITRWPLAALFVLKDPTQNAVQQYIDQGLTDGGSVIYQRPAHDVPEGQYECYRTWTTSEAAQAWLDGIDAIATPLGYTCLEKRLVP